MPRAAGSRPRTHEAAADDQQVDVDVDRQRRSATAAPASLAGSRVSFASWVGGSGSRAGGLSDEGPPPRAGTEPTDTIMVAAANTMLVTQVQVGDTTATCGGSPPSYA